MSNVKLISDVMKELKTRSSDAFKLVRNWREMIPAGSHWSPGCPGDPNCQECNGTGYVRIDGLPIEHPYFGKILFCECAAEKVRQWEARKMAEVETESLRAIPAKFR